MVLASIVALLLMVNPLQLPTTVIIGSWSRGVKIGQKQHRKHGSTEGALRASESAAFAALGITRENRR